MSCVYKPTVLTGSVVHDEPDTDSASLFAQGYDNSILSLAKNADVLSEASRAFGPPQDFSKVLRPKSAGFCNCRIDPDFENFRNMVLRLLTNVQEDVQGYIQAGISLRKQEYVVLVEIRDRIDRCQRDIMLFIDTFSGEHMPRLRRQSSLLEVRNAKLQARAKNLLVNELDADKYLSTEPKRTKDLLEAENWKLKKELKELKTQYDLQLIRAQELIDKILDTVQVDSATNNRAVSLYTRPGSTSTKKAAKRELCTTQPKPSASRQTLQSIRRQLFELKNDMIDLQTLVRNDKCGPACPHEQALHNLLKTIRQENEMLPSSKANISESVSGRATSDIITAVHAIKRLFDAAPDQLNASADDLLQTENDALKRELANHKDRIQTLECENIALLREVSSTKQNLDKIQKSTSSLLASNSAKPQDGCQYGATTTAPAVSTLLQERSILCHKLQKKDAELTKLQTEVDEVMLELINLHERYNELEKNAASDRTKRDIDGAQCPLKQQEQTAHKDVTPRCDDKVTSEDVVDFSALYSNHKAISAAIANSSHGPVEKSAKANRRKSTVRAKN